MDKRSEAGQAGGGPLDGRVRPHLGIASAEAYFATIDEIICSFLLASSSSSTRSATASLPSGIGSAAMALLLSGDE
jgi:hypothetical protein